MTTTKTPRVEISEQDHDGQKVYHWQIFDAAGNEFSHSAYHTDKTTCEAEAAARLEHAVAEGWL